jgi:Family of unknown function (DUF6522)
MVVLPRVLSARRERTLNIASQGTRIPTAMAQLVHIDSGSNTLEVDAAIIGEGLKVDPSAVQRLMRQSEITSRCERGVAEDAGLLRLTFFYRGRRLRIIVDDTGAIVRRSVIDFGDQPLPRSLRRPGN